MLNKINCILRIGVALPATVLGTGLIIPATTVYASIAQPDEIIVTARRTEEVIQNVPISMTVFNQEMLDERNISNGADLAAYTPSLSVNTRFGSDQASFAIRGFTQEFRTTASVAVYFADVAAPRGGPSVTTGDGAGPGSFFDLQNVQVLKGPQGTLFGRNTTGGAIQLIPQEPKDKLGGYLEGSVGNFNMRRTQGVINIPLTDSVRARFGVDAQKRDGFVENISGIGPDRFNDINYVTGRASLMAELSDALQNYTIFSYTHSKNNGSLEGLFACAPATVLNLGTFCAPALSAQQGRFYVVANDTEDAFSELKQWQLINTTTWNVNTDFTVKNIFSYSNLYQNGKISIFDAGFKVPDFVGSSAGAGQSMSFYPQSPVNGLPISNQRGLSEELQFQGTALDEKLTWQSGLYFEISKPVEWTGSVTSSFLSCSPQWTLNGAPSTWRCIDPLGPYSPGGALGSAVGGFGKVKFIDEAVYSQGTYEISDDFRVTLGGRYTVDRATGEGEQTVYGQFPTSYPAGGPTEILCGVGGTGTDCRNRQSTKSEAPTWLIDFDYLPNPDVLVYAKYARGYRQGSVSIFAPEGLQTYAPEKVDAYEIGSKTTFHGPIPGTFNVAVFYNELSNQQLQAGYIPPVGQLGAPTTAILNAGSSTIQGAEIETTLKLTNDLAFNLAYTYLETRLNSIGKPPLDPNSVIKYTPPAFTAAPGGHLAQSPRHTVSTGLSYQLPLPASVGGVSVGATYSFVDSQIVAFSEPYGTLPARRLLSLNAGWKGIMGSAFDASLFVTNAFNDKQTVYVPGYNEQAGIEFRQVGEPRMLGARLRYTFD